MRKLLTLALFTTYTKGSIKNSQFQALNGKADDYHCFHVQDGTYLNYFEEELFANSLAQTITDCKLKNMKAIWVKLTVEQLKLAPKLIQQGFEMHHCTNNYLLFSQWIVEEELNRLPHYTTHNVGAGGLIIQDDKVLLIQEKNGQKAGLWAIPGGLADDGELIIEAATREVFEETGLDVIPQDLFLFRDLPIANKYYGDLYFVIKMKLKNPQQLVSIQTSEINNYQWVPLNQLNKFIQENKFGPTQIRVMEALIEYSNSKRFGCQLFSIDSKPRVYYDKTRKYCLFKPNL